MHGTVIGLQDLKVRSAKEDFPRVFLKWGIDVSELLSIVTIRIDENGRKIFLFHAFTCKLRKVIDVFDGDVEAVKGFFQRSSFA